jgi:hypothetical protein
VLIDPNGRITDERFDANGYFFNRNDDRFGIDGFFDRLIERDGDRWAVELYSIDYHTPPMSSCVHFGEVNGRGVLALCPPNKAYCWCRDDDVIDFCDESFSHDQQDHVKVLEHGIPSYRYMMDCRDGRKINSTLVHQFFSMLNIYRSDISGAEKLSLESTLAELAGDMKFDNIDDAAQMIVPLVPEIVSEFCSFLNLFKERKTVWTLRPLLYSYWS